MCCKRQDGEIRVVEIERKFLVLPGQWPKGENQIQMRQGYLADQDGLVCRVRQKNDDFYLSLKARIDSVSSYDYEYRIPAEDGITMLEKICTATPVSKLRHEVPINGLTWEIDEFQALNSGLVVAEIELPAADYPLELPQWLGSEVTEDYRYRNSALYQLPWSQWDPSERQ